MIMINVNLNNASNVDNTTKNDNDEHNRYYNQLF